MSPTVGKCNKIRHIVRIRQMLRQWRKKAASSSTSRFTGVSVPSDVAPGQVPIYVGTNCKRFVVRATYLNHPIFKKLLVQAEKEYGFTNPGPLAIPCDESEFEEILRFMSGPESVISDRFNSLEDFQRCRLVGYDSLGESRPLLNGLSDESVF
ncbi:unnamed protein product [Ilex paraguariensis]|uniref:Small auxin up regulated protein n=1 Tax=Ilex paraguariensis TaxID=185542 RepID=A0ABC8SXX8_9AQUA